MLIITILECFMGLVRANARYNDMRATHITKLPPDTTMYMHMSTDVTPIVKLNVMISMRVDVECKILFTRRATIAMVRVSVTRGVPDRVTIPAKYTTSTPFSHGKDPIRRTMRLDTVQNA